MTIRNIIFIFFLLTVSSCKVINRNRMFQTPDDYTFNQVSEEVDLDYKIVPNDVINFQLYANDGFQLINIVSTSQTGNSMNAGGGITSYVVEHDGFIKLPVVHRIYVKGLTIRQLEMMLEDIFAETYHKPFVIIKVTNRRVFVFAGAKTTIIQLTSDNTTLFEVLAGIGGIPDNSFADQIKIIRGNPKNPEIYKIDLSTIEGMKSSGIVIQGDDIIYIETRKETITKTLALLAPYFSLISTGLLIYGLATRFGN